MTRRQAKERVFRVFHAVNFGQPAPRGQVWEYALVAEVTATDVERVFELTNHNGEDWTLRPNVRAFIRPCRSTSVGDMIMTPDDEAYLVEPVGLRRVTSSTH